MPTDDTRNLVALDLWTNELAVSVRCRGIRQAWRATLTRREMTVEVPGASGRRDHPR